jgi:hypothetical protein
MASVRARNTEIEVRDFKIATQGLEFVQWIMTISSNPVRISERGIGIGRCSDCGINEMLFEHEWDNVILFLCRECGSDYTSQTAPVGAGAGRE